MEHNEFQLCNMFFECAIAEATILICPAMGITAKYYNNLAVWLSEQGYSVMVIDYPGTGSSENLIKQPVTFNNWVNYIQLAGQWLKQQNLNKPLVLLGHSIGSQLFGFIEETNLFDKAVFLASSTGYWKDGNFPKKWVNFLLLIFILPLSNLLWGYTNAKFFKQSENYPKLPSRQWRKWCLNKDYLKVDLNSQQNNNFNKFNKKVTSIWFSDDPIANKITTLKLINIFKIARTNLVEINPISIGHKKIGHSGFLSRKYNNSLWPVILNHIKNDL